MVSVAVQSQALRGYDCSGDQGAYWWLSPHQLLICLVDGIGHGSLACDAALRCLSVVEDVRFRPLSEIINCCNDALRTTRGVAAALCKWNLQVGQIEFIGVGNIRSSVVGTRVHRLTSKQGILGNEPYLTLVPQIVPCCEGQESLFLCSDGVSDSLPYQQYTHSVLYPNLPAMIEELLGEWGNADDDAAILVAR